MSLIKCKMCGGELNVKENEQLVTCDYCGSTQTIPVVNDERILKLIARGNNLRINKEFDKAYNIFEQLILEDGKNAENYWNLLLCKYGITYVDDYDGKKIPTINRMSPVSILDDDDFKKTKELADVVTRSTYIDEATKIAEIQKRINDIMKTIEPFDVFISYKETDEFGDRTKDSILAQEIYETLTKEGLKVFLSRITLSSVAGSEYEPYIYSALYTSKLMILVTTSEDYVNAVWVKNEWSRFLAMMKNDTSKKLIPCYKDMDAYDLPKELRNIQGLDMSKLGFIQDLLVGVRKILHLQKNEPTYQRYEEQPRDVSRKDVVSDVKQLIKIGKIQLATKKLEELLIEYPLMEKIEIEIAKPWAPVGLPLETVSVDICRGWHTAYIALGSNMGDTKGYLDDAVRKLDSLDTCRVAKVADYIETEPYGGVEQDNFLNSALELRTLLYPEELLRLLNQTEAEAGRERTIHWGPRTLDLDILFYDDCVIDIPSLTVPHIDLQNRDFVLVPMVQLAPYLRHPVLHRTMRQLLDALEG